METSTVRPSRRGRDFSQELYDRGWYHSFALPDGERIAGFIPLETLQWRWSRFPIPAVLQGKRLLDTGAWDGWFSFEAERRGAQVTAIDCVEVPHFLEIHSRLGSRVDYRVLDFYELAEAQLGVFDYVLFLGILYHLKHPLLALEMVCALTTGTAIVESFVTDGDTWREHIVDIPTMEFYETDELGNQLDNWIGPSVGCLLAMCRAAGFARVELMYAAGAQAGVACYRKWEPVTNPQQAAPDLADVANTRTTGVNFSTRKEEYISCWFRTAREKVTRDELRFEVGGFGVPALFVRHDPDGKWMANFRLPPGLGGGWNEVRLRFADSDFGHTMRSICRCGRTAWSWWALATAPTGRWRRLRWATADISAPGCRAYRRIATVTTSAFCWIPRVSRSTTWATRMRTEIARSTPSFRGVLPKAITCSASSAREFLRSRLR
jgi:tRNA (mo5U34)-methyltransferase